MSQIAAARDATWHSNTTSVAGLALDRLSPSQMKFVEPMLAKPVPELPEGLNYAAAANPLRSSQPALCA
jgi:hypothetical protein